MDKRPKISIIIPVYNVENYMSRCLESVINQTLLDIEIICVNDGTKDGSVEIVKNYMRHDARIQLVEKENGGLASARNAGMEVATGDTLLFLDSDDYLETNACERIYEEKLNRNADIIVFGSIPFPEIPEPDSWVVWKLDCHNAYYPVFHPDALFKEPCGSPFAWNRAFSREFIKRNGLRFPEDVLFGEDIVFIFEAAPLAGSIQFIADKLHHYQCFRQGSLMHEYNSEVEKKMIQHVKNMKRITEFWHKHDLISKWGTDYTEWFLEFLVPDLLQYHPANSKRLAAEALKIMKQYGLLEKVKSIPVSQRAKFRRLVKIAKRK